MDVTDASVTAHPRPVGVVELVRVPVRRWRTVAAAAALLTIGAAGYFLLTPATWTGTTVVVVRPVVTDPFSLPNGGADRAVNMTAENGIATGSGVIDKVAAATERSPADVTAALVVENPVGGQVLRFDFDGLSPAQAAAGANTAAAAYLELRQAMYDSQRTAVLKSYDETIKLVTSQRDDIQKALRGAARDDVSSPRFAAQLDQIRSLNDQLATLAGQRSKIASADLRPGVVTNAARGPLPSSRDSTALSLFAALLGGLVVGVVVSFVLEGADSRIRGTAQAVEAAGAPLLGRVRRGGSDADMRYLALSVASWTEHQPGRPLVVLSDRADEGRAEVSAGLAAALAEAGHEVYLGGTEEIVESLRELLLAAQSRTPPRITRHRVARPMPAEPQPSATVPDFAAPPLGTIPPQTLPTTPAPAPGPVPMAVEAINGHAATTMLLAPEPSRPVVPHRVEAASGSRAAVPTRNASDLLAIGSGSVRLGPLETDNPEHLIILDGPPATDDDRGVWAARSGRALMVACSDRTRTAALSRLTERVLAAGVTPLGVVLTGSDRG